MALKEQESVGLPLGEERDPRYQQPHYRRAGDERAREWCAEEVRDGVSPVSNTVSRPGVLQAHVPQVHAGKKAGTYALAAQRAAHTSSAASGRKGALCPPLALEVLGLAARELSRSAATPLTCELCRSSAACMLASRRRALLCSATPPAMPSDGPTRTSSDTPWSRACMLSSVWYSIKACLFSDSCH